MPLIVVAVCILSLVLLVSRFKINPFLAFLIVSIGGALGLGIDPGKIGAVLAKGLGDMFGSVAVVIVTGAMLGKLVAVSGAAQRIASSLIALFGVRYLQWALVLTGLTIGIPLFYNVGFVLVFPLIASIIYQYRLPPFVVALPLLAALSVTHGFLPPHPAPAALVVQFKSNMGVTLFYGLMIAIPTAIIAGVYFSRSLRGLAATPLRSFTPTELPVERLPGLVVCLFSALLPVLLLAAVTIANLSLDQDSPMRRYTTLLGDSSVLMLLSLCVVTFTLGVSQGMKLPQIMGDYAAAVQDVVMVVLITAGAGAMKEVFVQGGVSQLIAGMLDGFNINLLLLAWAITAVIRVCVGSATVAGLTAAGIVAPLLTTHPELNPNLLVLVVGAGSLMFSHVNDSGFWLFKEYFGLSIKDTIRSWSVMESIASVGGLVGVLVLDLFV